MLRSLRPSFLRNIGERQLLSPGKPMIAGCIRDESVVEQVLLNEVLWRSDWNATDVEVELGQEAPGLLDALIERTISYPPTE